MITKPIFNYDIIYILQNNILSISYKLYVLLTTIYIIKIGWKYFNSKIFIIIFKRKKNIWIWYIKIHLHVKNEVIYHFVKKKFSKENDINIRIFLTNENPIEVLKKLNA